MSSSTSTSTTAGSSRCSATQSASTSDVSRLMRRKRYGVSASWSLRSECETDDARRAAVRRPAGCDDPRPPGLGLARPPRSATGPAGSRRARPGSSPTQAATTAATVGDPYAYQPVHATSSSTGRCRRYGYMVCCPAVAIQRPTRDLTNDPPGIASISAIGEDCRDGQRDRAGQRRRGSAPGASVLVAVPAEEDRPVEVRLPDQHEGRCCREHRQPEPLHPTGPRRAGAGPTPGRRATGRRRTSAGSRPSAAATAARPMAGLAPATSAIRRARSAPRARRPWNHGASSRQVARDTRNHRPNVWYDERPGRLMPEQHVA